MTTMCNIVIEKGSDWWLSHANVSFFLALLHEDLWNVNRINIHFVCTTHSVIRCKWEKFHYSMSEWVRESEAVELSLFIFSFSSRGGCRCKINFHLRRRWGNPRALNKLTSMCVTQVWHKFTLCLLIKLIKHLRSCGGSFCFWRA